MGKKHCGSEPRESYCCCLSQDRNSSAWYFGCFLTYVNSQCWRGSFWHNLRVYTTNMAPGCAEQWRRVKTFTRPGQKHSHHWQLLRDGADYSSSFFFFCFFWHPNAPDKVLFTPTTAQATVVESSRVCNFPKPRFLSITRQSVLLSRGNIRLISGDNKIIYCKETTQWWVDHHTHTHTHTQFLL